MSAPYQGVRERVVEPISSIRDLRRDVIMFANFDRILRNIWFGAQHIPAVFGGNWDSMPILCALGV